MAISKEVRKSFGIVGVRKPPKKLKKYVRIEKEAKARRKGEVLGEYQAHKKKPFIESLKIHMGEILNRIDPLEVIAVTGMTILVHGTILTTTELLDKAKSYGASLTMGWDVSALLVNVIQSAGLPKEKPVPPDTWQLWLTSFTIAYILVHNAGQIIGGIADVTTKLPAFIGMLL